MSILFLDCDGVLNHRTWLIQLHRRRQAGDAAALEGGLTGAAAIDPACVARLNAIVQRSRCDVVLSSTWRYVHTPGAMSRILRSLGYSGRIISSTPKAGECSGIGPDRGHQIQAWLDERSDSPICILDDNSDMAHLARRLVQTDHETGLLDEHVERAVAMLGGAT